MIAIVLGRVVIGNRRARSQRYAGPSRLEGLDRGLYTGNGALNVVIIRQKSCSYRPASDSAFRKLGRGSDVRRISQMPTSSEAA